MIEARMSNSHLDDNTLWRWHSQELEGAEKTAVQNHLQDCPSCQQRAQAIRGLIATMQATHHTVKPTMTEQVQLVRALEAQFARVGMPSELVAASRQLVRWLAPAVAVLTILFMLLRHEAAPPADNLNSLLPEIPESRLLLATTDQQLEQAMLDVALSSEETKR